MGKRQRTDDDGTEVKAKLRKSNDEYDGNGAAVVVDSDQESLPDILKLHVICCELFDYLSLEDLNSLGKTGNRLHRLVSFYFQQNYSMS